MPPRHIPSLDGLRAIAVLLVLWCHVPIVDGSYPGWLFAAWWWVNPGEFGVELFFALSGFLITRILIAERDAGVPVRWFLLRRVLRIFPIYYLLLLVMLPWRPAAQIGWSALYLGNFAETFTAGFAPGPLGHTWSLCVEEHFYLLWPLVVAFTGNRTARRVLLGIVIPAALLGTLATALWASPEFAEKAIHRLSPFRFLTLACGALVAFAEPRLAANGARPWRLGLLLAAAGLVLHPKVWFALLPAHYYEIGAMHVVAQWPAALGPVVDRVHFALLATGILLLCLGTPAKDLARPGLLAAAPLRAIGRISYGLYLYHLPIYHLILHPKSAETVTSPRVALAVAVAFAAAGTSYLVIERPILRYASRFRRPGA